MSNAFNARPDPSRSSPLSGDEASFWHSILGHQPDHYDLYRQVEQGRQVYRENRLSQHITPHLLDQAISLSRIARHRVDTS